MIKLIHADEKISADHDNQSNLRSICYLVWLILPLDNFKKGMSHKHLLIILPVLPFLTFHLAWPSVWGILNKPDWDQVG